MSLPAQACIHFEKTKKPLYPQGLFHVNLYAEDGGRTRTVVTYRRILSPVRLPIPPPRHDVKCDAVTDVALVTTIYYVCLHSMISAVIAEHQYII